MTQRQNAKNKMYKKVLSFLKANVTVFGGFARLVTEINNFIALNGSLDGFIQQQGQVTSGIAAGKKTVFGELVTDIVTAARKALVFAKDQGNEAMQAALDVRERDFDQLAGVRALARMEQIFGILEGNAAALADYMVSAEDIGAIEDGIECFYGAATRAGGGEECACGGAKKYGGNDGGDRQEPGGDR